MRGRRGTNSHSRFAWQAWHKLTSTIVLRGRRGTDGTGWRAWSDLVACDAAALCVAGVAQTHIYSRFAWQAWHKLTSTIVLRGRRGTDGTGWRAWSDLVARDAAALCVAGVAQTHIYSRFAWQAWHKLTSTIVLRGRRGTDGTGWRAWSDLVARDAAALCVAGVAQTHIVVLRGRRGTNSHLPSFCVAGVALMALGGALGLIWSPVTPRLFAWQVWHKLTSTIVLRGRRCTNSHLPSFCVAGVALMALGGALGLIWSPVTPRHFAWQAWHKLTSTVVLRGRCGTNSHLPTIVLRGRRGTDGTGWRAWSDLVAHDAAALCVAGVAQTHIYHRFAWQAWHKLTSTIVLRGRRGTDGTGWRAWSDLVARDAAALCVAGVAQTHIYSRFAWQVWHQLTSTIVLRGRRGTDGTGWRAWSDLVARDAAALCVAGVAQTHIYSRFAWQAWHKLTSTIVLRGRRGTDGTGWRAWSDLVARDAAALCVAGVAQTHIYSRFAWQAWHKLTSTIVLRGRRGTDGTGWRAWSDLVARDATALCVAGVAQTHIYSRFAWQAWHKLTSTIVLRGRRGTDGTGWRAWSDLVARDAAALCVAGVAQTHIYSRCVAGVAQTHIYHGFAWQAWH